MKISRLITFLTFIVATYLCACAETRLPKLPDDMKSPAQRAAYIMLHIWDFPENLSSPENAEQALSDFLSVADARVAPAEAYVNAVNTLTTKAQAAGIDILTLAAKYTADPYAPFFDDELYLPFVDAALASKKLLDSTPGLKERLTYDRACILKNRVGDPAASFNVQLRSGATTPVEKLFTAPLNLLVLFDPFCDHCREILTGLSESSSLAKAIADGNVSVTAVWIEAQDSADALAFPSVKEWNVAADRTGVMDKELYEFPIMPSVYVIDNKGIIVDKNLVEVAKILAALGITD